MGLRGGHVRVTLTDGSGGRLKAVAWRCEGTELGRRLLVEGGGAIHVAGRLKPAHTPAGVTVSGDISLDDLRTVFPGY